MADISKILKAYQRWNLNYTDNILTTEAAEDQIKHYYLGLLPEKKVSIVEEAKKHGDMVIPDILEETDYMDGWNACVDQMAKNIREQK